MEKKVKKKAVKKIWKYQDPKKEAYRSRKR